MKKQSDLFVLSAKKNHLLNKKEQDLIHQNAKVDLKFYSPAQLQKYIKMVRGLRDKYRDLGQRQRAANKNGNNARTFEKARIFERLLTAYRAQRASEQKK